MSSILSSLTGHFKVDPKVKELERGLRFRNWAHDQKAAMTMILPMLFVSAAILIPATVVNFSRDPVGGILTMFVGIVGLGGLSFLWVRKASTPEVDAANKKRKDKKRSISLSRETAKALGEDVIPALTKEHVEAGIRFDKKMYRHRGQWNRVDFHGIRSLLLEDLSREDAIISIVTERGLLTFPEVRNALSEMESNGKPLQDGWL